MPSRFFLWDGISISPAAAAGASPERVLLGWAAAGGALGGVLAMQLFRHKTLHRHFSVGMPVMLAVQLLLGAAVQLWL